MNWQDQLIYVYLNVYEFFLQESPAQNLRISPNSNPTFTDQEVITIYIFGIMQGYTTIKKIHKYITEHLYEWFPEIPQNAGYDYRLNLLEEVLNKFGIFFIQKLNCKNKNKENIIVVDSFPIILAKGFRSTCAKVAKSVCSQGYCASKKLYYWRQSLRKEVAQGGSSDESAYSKIVSSFRQSIEIFFNWIIEMTGIQNASKTDQKKDSFFPLT